MRSTHTNLRRGGRLTGVTSRWSRRASLRYTPPVSSSAAGRGQLSLSSPAGTCTGLFLRPCTALLSYACDTRQLWHTAHVPGTWLIVATAGRPYSVSEIQHVSEPSHVRDSTCVTALPSHACHSCNSSIKRTSGLDALGAGTARFMPRLALPTCYNSPTSHLNL